jgi:hypothetical protein
MRAFLLASGAAKTLQGIRRIPKFNVIFDRSKNLHALVDVAASRLRARTAVRQMLEEIRPRMLLFEGFAALEHFKKQQEPVAVTPVPMKLRQLRTERLQLDARGVLGRPVLAIALAHPTGFRWRTSDWQQAAMKVAALLSGR